MMTKDEALKMAIKRLIKLSCLLSYEGGDGWDNPLKEDLELINACKEALEQPLTRDWKETIDERIARDIEFKEALEQPAQEPVGGIVMKDKNGYPMAAFNTTDLEIGDFLYTHPHQWQGLDAVEVSNIFISKEVNGDATKFAQAIEQALRSKNGY